jgi:hypothetical protein
MAFFYRSYVPRAEPWMTPRNDLGTPYAPAHRPSAAGDGVLHTVWLAVSLVAMLAATFGLSCLAYSHLAAESERTTQGPLGELWNGVLP